MNRRLLWLVLAVVPALMPCDAFAQSPTTTEIYSIASPSPVSETFTISAVVSSVDGAPSGEVEFFDGDALLATTSLTSVGGVGVASVQFIADEPGPRALRARYVGGSEHAESSSLTLLHLVVPPAR